MASHDLRDADTAEVAFHAALTGHLVFSTLHTNSAVATIARLFDLGLKPYVVASALEAVIAQRLARRICEGCREPAPADPAKLAQLGPLFEPGKVKTFHGKGCKQCNETGYSGRAGIYEVLVPHDHIKHVIASGASVLEMTKLVAENGMTTLIKDARHRVEQGLTTIDEVLRVLGPQVID